MSYKDGDEMIDTNTLKGLIVKKGLSQKALADKLGVTPKTFYNKMSKGKFNSDEMYKMIKILGIKEPSKIFFANRVT